MLKLQGEMGDRIDHHLDNYLAAPRQLSQVSEDTIESGLIQPQELEKIGRFFWLKAAL